MGHGFAGSGLWIALRRPLFETNAELGNPGGRAESFLPISIYRNRPHGEHLAESNTGRIAGLLYGNHRPLETALSYAVATTAAVLHGRWQLVRNQTAYRLRRLDRNFLYAHRTFQNGLVLISPYARL